MKPVDRYRLALCLLLLSFTQALTLDAPGYEQADEETTRRLLNMANGIEAESDDVIVAYEPAEMETLMTGFKNNMAPYSGVGDRELRKNLNEMLYDFHHPMTDRYNNEYTHFSRVCRHLLEKEHIQTRVRRTTGHLPKLLVDMEQACKDFLEQPSEENLEKVEDLDAEMLQEVICLERGKPVGVQRNCRSQQREARSVFEGEASETAIDNGLPSDEEIDGYNEELLKYCPEKHNYDHSRVRRSASPGAMFSADMLEYMDCICDNKTNCGHLAFKVGKSFRADIAEPMASQIGEGLEEGNELEKQAAEDIQEAKSHFVAPGNKSYEEALKETEHLVNVNRRKKRAFNRPDVVKLPLQELAKGVGCAIVIHKDRPIQVFACTFKKVLKIELKLIWTNVLPRIELNIKACVPVVSDIVDFITKYVKPLNTFLKQFDIENGCLLLARAYVDFYKGIFEIISNVPQKYLLLFRAKLRSSLLIRFDTSRPTDNKEERERLNLHGGRTYLRLQSTFRIQAFEVWKLFSGGWACIFCHTLIDKSIPLGEDKRPLRKEGDPPLPPGYRIVDEGVKGTGRVEVENDGTFGTVCDDGFDEFSGEVFCRSVGFHGYLGIWNDVPPGEGEIHLSQLKCTGKEAGLFDCPRSKDVGATGCEHSEDVGVRCFTEDTACHGVIPYGIMTASSGDPSKIHFDSPGGWLADSAAEAWVMVDLYFNHKITGIRTMAHKTDPSWVTEFRFHVYNETWNFNKDASGNEKVYKGNFDGTNIKSNFWWPPLIGTQVKILIDKFNNKPALRMEIHGCDMDDATTMENAVTYQSSVLMGGFSRLAVDGNKNNDFRLRSCTHTAEQRNPWWAIDIGRPMNVEGLRVTNRGDCCGDRLNDFIVEVGNRLSLENGADGEVCAVHPGAVPDGGNKVIFCVGAPTGRFVQIKKRGYGILTLCEVQLWVSPAAVDACDEEAKDKIDCGLTSQQECEENGCCWNPGGSPQCYSVNTMIPPDSDCMESLFVGEPRTVVSVSSTYGNNPASTGVEGDFGPSRARLDTMVNAVEGTDYAHGGWKAGVNNEHQYIEVKFPEVWSVRKIVTQGANNGEEWVIRYKVYVSYDGNYWTQVGGIIEANSDSDSKAINEFQVFAAKMLRINPIDVHIYPGLRFEIFGCKDCLISLFTRYPFANVLSSSRYKRDLAYAAHRARLGTMEEANPFSYGGWKADRNLPGEWVEIGFGSSRTVRAVILEPAQGKNEYVKRYAVEHKNELLESYTREGEYPGCPNEKTSVTNFIRNPFSAHSMRLVVIEFFGAVSMRFDILGCDSSMSGGLQKKYEDLGHNDIRPYVFYVDEKVAADQAEAKCKEHGANLADMKRLSRVYEQKNFEVKCSYGYASSENGNVIAATLNMFDHTVEGCSSPGAHEVPEVPEGKLLGVFCTTASQGIVYRETNGIFPDGHEKTCRLLGGRILRYYELALSRNYDECRIGLFFKDMDYVTESACDASREDSKQFYPDVKGVYCYLPALTLGMLPPAYIRLRRTAEYFIHETHSYSGWSIFRQEKITTDQYLLGHIVGDNSNKIALDGTFLAVEPFDSGILAPAESFKEIVSEPIVYLHPICPAGYRRVGDIHLHTSWDDEFQNQIRSKFRCVREEFLAKCTTGTSYNTNEGVTLYQHSPLDLQSCFTGSFFTAVGEDSEIEDPYCILLGVADFGEI